MTAHIISAKQAATHRHVFINATAQSHKHTQLHIFITQPEQTGLHKLLAIT